MPNFKEKYTLSAMNPAGTCKEGTASFEGILKYVCLVRDFKVLGVTALRVVDLNVAPVLGSTQEKSTAYSLGD